MIRDLPILAVTPGEPAGIGPEILTSLLAANTGHRIIAVADINLLRERSRQSGSDIRIVPWQPGDPVDTGKLSCFHVDLPEQAVPGRLSTANGQYVLDTIREAAKLTTLGHAAALVTGPVHKAVINDAGVPFSGHTEFLAEISATKKVVMMLAAPGIRVALVTTHLPLRDVADAIDAPMLEEVLRITDHDLRHRFGISNPHMQVLGLNPHAGEGGHLGMEEIEVITPTLKRCIEKGMNITGPVPADTAFNPDRLAECDVVVAMYHDQGLPVLKHAGFGEAVNITLGLPFIRTSVDHGTALDIAGKGIADHSSLQHAIDMAQQMAASH